ncbi:hypothetical protein EMCG_04005 [[Emmonsia] crescens]|uniref:Uncharacterized protein n=1 Tax=[Emmonsia] crescens TaxID=73230 RepID=A0A0G2HUE8_9EURO|nr:hypothetical protein EMCG_04005 [Emmonsia crescens UAMH 3008]
MSPVNQFPDFMDEGYSHKRFLKALGADILEIFSRLKENRLRRFSWQLGTCIPICVFGPSGYMTTHQLLLEDISLITDGTCTRARGCLSELRRFRRLKRFSWKGINMKHDCDALNNLLRSNCRNLKAIELHFVRKEGHEEQDNATSKFTSLVLKSAPDSLLRFESLRSLSLCHISFRSAYEELAFALNFSQLLSLKLIHCAFVVPFIEAVVDSNKEIKLKTFEIVFRGKSDVKLKNGGHPLQKFLTSFVGLEELNISLQNAPIPFLGAIIHHKLTLRSLIQHERYIVRDNSSDYFNEERDFSLTPGTGHINVREYCDLETVGLCVQPSHLKEQLKHVSLQMRWKLLHLRLSGSDDMDINIKADVEEALLQEILCIRQGVYHEFDHEFDFEVAIAGAYGDDDSDSGDGSDAGGGGYGVDDNNPGSQPNQPDSDETDFPEDYYLTWPLIKIPVPLGLIKFVNWAFGRNGLPHLRILAYGDFSHQGRFKNSQLLFCRKGAAVSGVQAGNWFGSRYLTHARASQLSFRLMAEQDKELWRSLNLRPFDLGVCPTENLLLPELLDETD